MKSMTTHRHTMIATLLLLCLQQNLAGFNLKKAVSHSVAVIKDTGGDVANVTKKAVKDVTNGAVDLREAVLDPVTKPIAEALVKTRDNIVHADLHLQRLKLETVHMPQIKSPAYVQKRLGQLRFPTVSVPQLPSIAQALGNFNAGLGAIRVNNPLLQNLANFVDYAGDGIKNTSDAFVVNWKILGHDLSAENKDFWQANDDDWMKIRDAGGGFSDNYHDFVKKNDDGYLHAREVAKNCIDDLSHCIKLPSGESNDCESMSTKSAQIECYRKRSAGLSAELEARRQRAEKISSTLFNALDSKVNDYSNALNEATVD